MPIVLSADLGSPPVPYAGAVNSAVRAFLAEPAVADPPARVWRDWALVGTIAIGAVLETVFRTDLVWPVVSLLVCLVFVPTLLWRRTHPLAMTIIAFGVINAMSILGTVFSDGVPGLYTTATVLILPYTLFRWGSGRDAAIGVGIMIAAWAIGITTDPSTIGEAVGGLVVLSVPVLAGSTIRYRTTARARAIDEVRSREREQLARELHDTVAHHVSAIAVQAQAGQALAATRPDQALGVLPAIEAAASRTLAEMRSMVGALRQGDALGLAPQSGIADIDRLARSIPDGLELTVGLTGDLDSVGAAIDAAVYRIAQESITNAVRHARAATRIDVAVCGLSDRVELSIVDDGGPVAHHGDTPTGYGLLGMAERAKLLGGTVTAGPLPGGGWRVAAELPRRRRP